MNEILGIAVPGGMALIGMLAIVSGLAAVLVFPRPLLIGFIVCMVLLASSSTYGLEDAGDANVFWVKGTRTFFFSFVEMGIVGAWLAMLYRRAWLSDAQPMLPLSKYYIGFAALLLGHLLVGLFDPQRIWILDLSQRGFSNLLLQGMFVALIAANLRTERDLKLVLTVLIVCLAGRHLFGLVRYVALGGDPQNAYAVLGGSSVKITFWDINDLILASAMFAVCVYLLLTQPPRALWQRWFLGIGALMAAVVPLLSARRTGQGGLLLAIALLAFLLPRGRRWVAVMAVVLAVPVVFVALGQRAGTEGGLMSRVMIDVTRDPWSDPRRSRFHEWRSAWESVREAPVFGLGPTGRFQPRSPVGLEYHKGSYDFVHSGFGHLLLKGGFVAVALFCGLLLAWVRYVWRQWPALTGHRRALAVVGLTGMAASLPNLAFGTPIPEIRTMLLMGFLLALPIVAARVALPAAVVPEAPRVRPARVTAWRPHGASP